MSDLKIEKAEVRTTKITADMAGFAASKSTTVKKSKLDGKTDCVVIHAGGLAIEVFEGDDVVERLDKSGKVFDTAIRSDHPLRATLKQRS